MSVTIGRTNSGTLYWHLLARIARHLVLAACRASSAHSRTVRLVSSCTLPYYRLRQLAGFELLAGLLLVTPWFRLSLKSVVPHIEALASDNGLFDTQLKHPDWQYFTFTCFTIIPGQNENFWKDAKLRL
jgi:hypothetical protein